MRKYAVIDKTVTIASGTRAFDNLDSNSLTYDNYVAISLPSGFYATSINCNKPYAGYITWPLETMVYFMCGVMLDFTR